MRKIRGGEAELAGRMRPGQWGGSRRRPRDPGFRWVAGGAVVDGAGSEHREPESGTGRRASGKTRPVRDKGRPVLTAKRWHLAGEQTPHRTLWGPAKAPRASLCNEGRGMDGPGQRFTADGDPRGCDARRESSLLRWQETWQ